MARRAPAFPPTKATLGGEPWTFLSKDKIIVNGDECWGVTDFIAREIHIERGTEAEGNKVEISLHEMFHVFFPQVDEEIIKNAAREAAVALEALDLVA